MNLGDVRTVLNYVPQFQGKTFVVALDGGVLASDNLSNFILDISVLRSLGVRIVLVFGIAPQVRDLASSRGLAIPSAEGRGPTDEATLGLAVDAIGRVTSQLTQGLAATGIRAASANVLTVYPAGIVGGVDQLFAGRVAGVDAGSLTTLLDKNLLPLVAPLGYDARGKTLYLNPDAVAAEVGIALKASKVLFASDHDGCPFAAKSPTQVSVREVQTLLAESGSEINAVAASRLRFAARACAEGVSRAHLIPAAHEEALLAELFSNVGIGAMIYADTYQTIRKAEPGDVDAIVSMTRRAVEDQQLVARGKDEVLAQLDDFWILEVDGNLVGCAALHVYENRATAEIASLFVSKTHVGQGYGSLLMTRLEEVARELKMERVVAFTTQAPEFFIDKCGYQKRGDLNWVSAERRAAYEASGRNSHLLWKPLA